MATINKEGNVIAHCPTCDGAKSSFEFVGTRGELGHVTKVFPSEYRHYGRDRVRSWIQLFRCNACGARAKGIFNIMDVHGSYPDDIWQLLEYYAEAKERLPLPKGIPNGIKREFREAELCSEAGCYRAAAGMLRSVLDKTLRANGYNVRENRNLNADRRSAADGVITKARQTRAHEEVRVDGDHVCGMTE